jgi:hypothetical protein
MAASMSSALTKMSFFLRSLRSGYRTRDNWKDELAKEVRKKAEERFYEAARLVEKQAAAAFLRILELVSPSLQTLSVSFRDMALPPSFAAGGLPKLRELTIAHGGGSLFGPDTVSHCALCSVDPIPSLRRLNLQLCDVICTPRWLIRHVAIFAPNITHLRLPVVYGSWEQALNPNEPHPDGGDKPLLPTTIQKILVQPCLPAGYMSGNGWLFYKSGLDQYRSLAKKDNRIVVLQPANWDGDKLSDDGELNTEWLDRLNGGNGCWKTDGRLLRT